MPRSKLDDMARIVMKLQRPGARVKVRGDKDSYIELDQRELREATKDSLTPPTILDKLAFSESYQYLENAKARFDTKSAVGYSDCKANCRNALMSALKTLTDKEDVSEAARELSRQGILGEREKEFTETFNKLLVILHGLDSKKGPHPPKTRDEDDAELVLGITTSILNYVTNQAIKRTGYLGK